MSPADLGPELLGLVLFAVATPIALLGPAIRRSLVRQECASWRDRLVDAARCGELEVGDWRLYSLIDWFDQVAGHGRISAAGRHARDRRAPSERLAFSLAAALAPGGVEQFAASPGGLGGFGASVQTSGAFAGPAVPGGPDLRAEATACRERLLHRVRLLRHLRGRPVELPNHGADVTGHARPSGALVLMSSVRTDDGPGALDLRDGPGSAGSGARSLTEEIFAVAGSAR